MGELLVQGAGPEGHGPDLGHGVGAAGQAARPERALDGGQDGRLVGVGLEPVERRPLERVGQAVARAGPPEPRQDVGPPP